VLSTKRMLNSFRCVFRRRKADEELDAEVRSCFEMLVDRYRDQGLSHEEAERAARWEFEGMEQVKDKVREVRAGSRFASLPQDIRFALRALRKSPSFTAVAILTLALGIGVNTAVFSVFYTVMLRPLPYDQPGQLGLIWSTFEKTAASRAPTAGPLLGEIKHRTRLLQDVAGIWVGNVTFTGDPHPEQVKVASVTPNFLTLLGVRPALGRVFAPDESAGGRPVILLSEGLWRRRFGADPNIVGKAVRTARASATVVGVLPPQFQLYFPPDAHVPSDVQAFMPFEYDVYRDNRTLYYIRVVARLKQGVSFEQAQQDLNAVAAQVRAAYTEYADENVKLEIVPIHGDAVREIRPAMIALFSGAGLVLLICCVNVANLLLARASDRRREVAVRSALGASRGRILRQLLIEGFMLCAIAGIAGVALGWAGLRGLLSLRPGYLTQMGDIGLNWPVLAFVAAVSLAAALVFGLAPGLESAKWDLIKTLREAGRDSQAPARRGVRTALIVCEVTLGFVLVIGAGLTIRTLANIQRVRPGFDATNVLTFEIDMQGKRYRTAPARINFVKEWEARIALLPGVESVGASYDVPLDDYPNWYSPYRPEGVSQNQGAGLLADHRCVTPGYLRAMGVRLLEGRYFDDRDRSGGRQVAIVDDLLAASTWPGQSAIGKKIEAEHVTDRGFDPVWAEVVGVVEHVQNHSLVQKLRPDLYIPYEQSPRTHLGYAVRTRVEPLSLAPVIRREMQKRDRDLAISKVRPMMAYVEQAKAPASFTAVLAGIFAGLALLLAAIGIYGVIYYSVSRRMHEMGVRMALGANGGDIIRLVMSEGLVLTALGLALGLAVSLAVSSYLRSLVYGISERDPLTYTVAIAVILAAAVLGCWRPAAKAASANPVDAMRAE
jgi:putative ABC transport system permease protein